MISLNNITKLIERKEKYIERMIGEGADQRRIDAVKSEIAIIREFISEALTAVDEMRDAIVSQGEYLERIEETKICAEAVCLLHGIIDYPCYVVKGSKYLINELKHQQREGYLYIPEQLKKLYA